MQASWLKRQWRERVSQRHERKNSGASELTNGMNGRKKKDVGATELINSVSKKTVAQASLSMVRA